MRPVAATNGVLHWSSRVVSALELERLRTEIHEIILPPSTVVTPSARDWLRQHGVTVTTQNGQPRRTTGWRIAQTRPFAAVQGVLEALNRDGLTFEPWSEPGWLSLAEAI